jgi:N4-gp56 family major capsid protein
MATGAGLGGQLPVTSGIAGTTRIATGGAYSQYVEPVGYFGANTLDNTGAGYAGSVATGTTMMGPAIQTIWSKEILFQSMPVLRFEQFAVKKTELGTMPGLSVNFMRYNNLPVPAGPLLEGIRMKTHAITANQYAITVAEQGFAVAVSELLLNASFDDIMASSSRLLGRNMALYMDTQARETLGRASSVVFGYKKPGAINTGYGVYEPGTPATTIAEVVASGATADPADDFWLTPHAVKDAVEVLSAKNIPRLGETYVCFIHPHQSRRLRDTPEWIEVTKYAAPGNFMLGEIGRLNDVVFIETTQITSPVSTVALTTPDAYPSLPGGQHITANPATYDWRGANLGLTAAQASALDDGSGPLTGTGLPAGPAHPGLAAAAYNPGTDAFADIDQDPTTAGQQAGPPPDVTPQYGVPGVGWGQPWGPYSGANSGVFEAMMLGDNAFGHAISLPVELRDGGVLDFGREHALAWYSIWGWGVVTESSVDKIITN